jgi:hypothetical protein
VPLLPTQQLFGLIGRLMTDTVDVMALVRDVAREA